MRAAFALGCMAGRQLAGQTLPPAGAVEWSTAPAPATRGTVVGL
jgi:hypothetical protein